MNEPIDISKMDKAEVLAALFNAAKPQGLGKFNFKPDHIMTSAEAATVLAERTRDGKAYFDYCEGRSLKVEISDGPLKVELYDRDNGDGAAARAIAEIPPPAFAA
jgi:hypothetical protein